MCTLLSLDITITIIILCRTGKVLLTVIKIPFSCEYQLITAFLVDKKTAHIHRISIDAHYVHDIVYMYIIMRSESKI